MIYISHRGNLNGPSSKTENTKEQILKCIELKYDVEIDLWFYNGFYFLGHDEPKEKIHKSFLLQHKDYLWCHAKSSDTLFNLKADNLHCFWHENDRYTITSRGFIWAYPGCPVNHRSICVMPEWNNHKIDNIREAYAICSDNVEYCKQQYKIR